MCGINGILDTQHKLSPELLARTASNMTQVLLHRGPDHGDTWHDAKAGIALGHRRLSILDLSPEGDQPMRSSCGRYLMVFNGEIYNHQEIRQRLQSTGVAFRGHSDTEVLLEAIAKGGVSNATRETTGMFAFAVWDRDARILHLVRDRMGEKPLYYGWINEVFVFGSELKAIRQCPGWASSIDRDSLASLLQYGYVSGTRSIHKQIKKLEPGTILSLGSDKTAREQIETFWSFDDVARRAMEHPFTGSLDDASHELEHLVRNSVRQQMIADVPLGAFLSGGVDSSAIVALMQQESTQKVRTFTIAFDDARYDEAAFARDVATRVGTEHTEITATASSLLEIIPRLPEIYDEPFADASQIPSVLVATLAREHVKVCLSGDAADELFGGYDRYRAGVRRWDLVRRFPVPLRGLLSASIKALSRSGLDTVKNRIAGLEQRARGNAIHRLGCLVGARELPQFYDTMNSRWLDGLPIAGYSSNTSPDETSILRAAHFMMHTDTQRYLPDDILTKIDRASMSASLETRIPLLDHRVVEFAWTLPSAFKAQGVGKTVWRNVLYRHVPAAIFDRPKQGFTPPLDAWLHGPLRDWAEDLLDESRLRQDGYLDAKRIQTKWSDYLKGRRNWRYDLWHVLMFQAWLRNSP